MKYIGPPLVIEMIYRHLVADIFSAIARGVRLAAQDTNLPEETIREAFYEKYPYFTSPGPMTQQLKLEMHDENSPRA